MVTEESKVFQVVYDYLDVPTLKKFTVDNSRVRMVMGAFGPVSGDTEFLSSAGWKRISDYSDEQIAQYSNETGEIEFIKPDEFVVAPCEQFYNFKGLGIDMMLSGKHRMLWRGDEGTFITLAEEAAARHWSQPIQQEIPNTFKVKVDTAIPLDDNAIRLQIAVIAEGSFHKDNAIDNCYCSMGFSKERKKIRIEHLLKLNKCEFKKTDYDNGKTYYYFQAPVKTKKFDSIFWIANDKQIKIILEELRQWDFHYSNGNTYQYSTIEKESADFIQYCFATQGIAVNITERDKKDGIRKILYRLNINSANRKNILFKSPDAVSYVKYGNGFKYCFKTSTGFFVARRNGKIFITGNSGKSSACVFDIIRRANEQKPGPDGIRRSRWAVVRNSYTQLKDTTIKTFHDWFPPRLFGEYRVTDHTYIITKFPNVHLEVLFRALDRPDQVSNLLSLELTGAWFNEAREIPMTIIDAMDGRIGRYPSGRDGGASWYGMIMDTNPPDDGSLLYKRFEIIRPENWKIFKQPSGLSAHAENTTHLPKNYYINLAKGKDEMYKRIYIDGQYGYLVNGKPVFQSFKDNIHVASHQLEPQKGLDVLTGYDFGLSPCCVIAQITPLGQLRILDELVSDGMGLRQFCENQLLPLLRLKYFGMNVVGFGDPSGVSRAPTDESTCFEILQSPEIGLRNVTPAPTNAILPRVAAVENFLNKMYAGEPSFILSPNCYYLRKAMNGGYHYEKESRSLGEEYKIMPVKNFSSHICLSGETMVLTPVGEKRIDEIKVGDFVVTPFGNRQVTAAGLTQKNAEVIEIIFSDGRKINCTEDHEFVKSNKNIVKSNALRYNDVLQDYNSWRTLKWSIQSLLSSRKRNIGFRQTIIIERKNDVAVNTERKVGLAEKFISSLVCIVGKVFKRRFLQERSSAEETVKHVIDTTAEKTTFKERVLFVAQTLKRINILKSKPVPKIAQISQFPEPKDVYNITVNIDHVFYANGILTGNCDALQYLCMFIAEKDVHDKRWKDLSSRVNLTDYKPVNSIGGY